jgi:hypothetical protein
MPLKVFNLLGEYMGVIYEITKYGPCEIILYSDEGLYVLLELAKKTRLSNYLTHLLTPFN